MHLGARGEACSRLLTPQRYETRGRGNPAPNIDRACQQHFLKPNKRYLSDGGEALSEVIDAGSLATNENHFWTSPPQTAERPLHWYAVPTSPRHEKRVREHLGRRGVECFLPLFRTIHRWKNA